MAVKDDEEFVLPVLTRFTISEGYNQFRSAKEIINQLQDIQKNSVEGQLGGVAITENVPTFDNNGLKYILCFTSLTISLLTIVFFLHHRYSRGK